jgi:uncharacterized protein
MKLGLAYGDARLTDRVVGAKLVDYVEVPFERFFQAPDLLDSLTVPCILHCASLSLAGDLPAAKSVLEKLRDLVMRSRTPWVGEHLAFLTMSREVSGDPGIITQSEATLSEETTAQSFTLGYTVSPQFSDEIIARVADALDRYEARIDCPLLIENGPVYFSLPGSTMSQAEFLTKLCQVRPDTRLLLDLAHLICTAANTGVDARTMLDALPLDRVVEVHLSGASAAAGVMWDDHAMPISEFAFSLLDRLLERARPRAITVEYNWDPSFPFAIIKQDLGRVRRALEQVRAAA